MRIRVLIALAALAAAILPALPGSAAWPAGWVHVAFEAPITEASRDALVAAGGQAIAALPGNTYLAWSDGDLSVEGATVTARTVADKVDRELGGRGMLHLVVLAHARTEAPLAARLAEHGDVADVRRESTARDLWAAYVTADLAGARAIAADPAVFYVGAAPTGFGSENERSAQIVAGNAGTGPGYEGWLDDVGVTGAGVNVTVVDSGVDPYHPDLAPALVGKVERSQSPTGEPMDGGGHGSHVAGIVAGRGVGLSAAGRPRPTEGGFLQGLGVAPGAGLVDQNMLGNSAAGPLCGGTWPPSDWESLTADALALDSHIWNASWQSCEGTGAGYIRSASEMDRLTRDGDSRTDGAQPFTMVFSAGNSGSGSNATDTRLTAPKEAKNTIVVASLDVGNPNTVSSSSSRGPARDGRIVPTVTAPGGGVLSTRSSTATASCSTPFTGGLPDGVLYASCSGTSMASPHVAGAVALVTEWWREANDGVDPSPAMVKALLVHTAVDMGDADIPNRNEGWGRVNLTNLFLGDADRAYVDQSVLLDDPADAHRVVVDADGDGPLRVTLVWTDTPGVPGASPALVNDLNLVVTAPDGTVYRGNAFAEGVSVPGGGADRINNTENVFLPSGAAGPWTIEVTAAALPGDGDPFAGDATDQDFALVVSS